MYINTMNKEKKNDLFFILQLMMESRCDVDNFYFNSIYCATISGFSTFLSCALFGDLMNGFGQVLNVSGRDAGDRNATVARQIDMEFAK
jgi:hypothetical protein